MTDRFDHAAWDAYIHANSHHLGSTVNVAFRLAGVAARCDARVAELEAVARNQRDTIGTLEQLLFSGRDPYLVGYDDAADQDRDAYIRLVARLQTRHHLVPAPNGAPGLVCAEHCAACELLADVAGHILDAADSGDRTSATASNGDHQ